MSGLIIKNLGKFFVESGKRRWLFHHVNLDFPSTGLFGVIGKSGSGKSTFLNLLAQLDRPSEGSICYGGHWIRNLEKKEERLFFQDRVGMVFQHYNLISGISVLENVALPLLMSGVSRKEAEAKALGSLQEVGLQGYERRNVDELSGGEKQRVAIARSQVNDPSFLLADEPTGALDEENSRIVMDLLQKASKHRLVIVVSHNLELVSSYCDGVCSLEGKTIQFLKKPQICGGKEINQPKKKKRKQFWSSIFLKRNLKRNILKNTWSFLSGFLGFSFLLLAIGYLHGSPKALQNNIKRSLEYPLFSVSRRHEVPLENSPLTLYQELRPSKEEVLDDLDGIEGFSIENDYSFFLPSVTGFRLGGKKEDPVSFLPVFDLCLREGGSSLLIKGELPKSNGLDSCLVNGEFLSSYEAKVGQWIEFERHGAIEEDGTKEEFAFPYRMKILGVVEEFGFLNKPKVYYSYSALRQLMQETELQEIRGEKGEVLTLADAVSLSEGDSYLSSYRFLLFFHDEKAQEAFLKRKEEGQTYLLYGNGPQEAGESFSLLSSAFATSLGFFVGIGMIEVSLILGMTSFANFVSKKKEVAVLRVLGGGEGEIQSIFLLESCCVGLLSAVLSLPISPLIASAFNSLLQKEFLMSGVIDIPLFRFLGIPFLLPAGLLLLSFLICFCSTAIPLKVAGKISLSKELTDE